jgi:hypothetical protein
MVKARFTDSSFSPPTTWTDSDGLLSSGNGDAIVHGVSTSYERVTSPVRSDVLRVSAGGLSVQRTFSAFGPLVLLDVRAPSTVSAGVPFTLRVYARDSLGSIVTNFAPAHASWTYDAFTTSPLAAFSNGVRSTEIVLPDSRQIAYV